MRQAKKYTKQNVKRQQNKGSNEVVIGASGELTKGDINYKDLDKIKTQCLHVGKNGKRCTRKCSGKNKYCFWHSSDGKY
ncbi:MAG: hypothetical protein LBK47_03260 [Prevotellaceae bacterium]|jgi:hypothetical protein|nr:hypothetical protein [Prevotellaceae bacterium]